MTQPEVKAPEQDYHYQVDQQVSVNARIQVEIDGETVDFQITSRYGASTEKILKTASHAIEAYQMLRQEFPRNFIAPPARKEPEYHPIIDGGEDGNSLPAVESFIADSLTVSMHNNKFYFKVMGGKFTKYGVTVWDEVMKAAGVTPDPANLPNIAGWKCEYITKQKDGKTVPDKVTRLLPKNGAAHKAIEAGPYGASPREEDFPF